MGPNEILSRIDRLVKADPRYRREAYLFVLAGLERAVERLEVRGHVTGKELLEALRVLGTERYGMMARTVFEHWGVRSTLDFGEIVFSMVDDRLMGKTEEDSLDDFRGVFDFEEAFERSHCWNVAGG
jgi:uncharacterized repeat protein (TIGR04138 family)